MLLLRVSIKSLYLELLSKTLISKKLILLLVTWHHINFLLAKTKLISELSDQTRVEMKKAMNQPI